MLEYVFIVLGNFSLMYCFILYVFIFTKDCLVYYIQVVTQSNFYN